MATLFCIVFQIVILCVIGNMFLMLKIFLWVLCISNPMVTLYLFLGPIYKHFCWFFAFQTPARIGADQFFDKPGNKCCHGNTFLLFLGLINNFMGSLHSITLHRLELISFSAIPGNKCCHGNTFLLFLGPIYKYFCIPYPYTDWSCLVFLAIPGNNCCHGNTFSLYSTYI